ncbi:MAG: hypothetical protein D6806_09640 [Deltaproteobacteria bacterium]|nr:MAG: hypothetical protein D6806_09640 [Deltaproteobacteria bacterium]
MMQTENAYALHEIVVTMVRTGRLEEAERLFPKIVGTGGDVFVFSWLVQAYADKGMHDHALWLAASRYDGTVLRDLAWHYIMNDDLESALDAIQVVPVGKESIITSILGWAVWKLVDQGRHEQARKFIRLGQEIASGAKDPEERLDAFVEFAETLYMAKCYDDAADMAERSLREAASVGPAKNDQEKRLIAFATARARAVLVRSLVKTGLYNQALEQAFKQAPVRSHTIVRLDTYWLLKDILDGMLRNNLVDLAYRTVLEIRKRPSGAKELPIDSCAIVLDRMKRLGTMKELCQVDDSDDVSWLCNVAVDRLKRNEVAAAVKWAISLPEPRFRRLCLIDLAAKSRSAGKSGLASMLVGKAASVQCGNLEKCNYSLTQLVSELQAQGKKAKARRLARRLLNRLSRQKDLNDNMLLSNELLVLAKVGECRSLIDFVSRRQLPYYKARRALEQCAEEGYISELLSLAATLPGYSSRVELVAKLAVEAHKMGWKAKGGDLKTIARLLE